MLLMITGKAATEDEKDDGEFIGEFVVKEEKLKI